MRAFMKVSQKYCVTWFRVFSVASRNDNERAVNYVRCADKKLSYHREITCVCVITGMLFKSFRVIDFGTKCKRISCPYTTSYYWITITYVLSCIVSKFSCNIGQIYAFNRWATLFNTLVLGNPCEIITHHTFARTTFFGLHFCRRQRGLTITSLTWWDPKATKFSEITQHNGHCVIQSHRFSYQSKDGMQLRMFDIFGKIYICLI